MELSLEEALALLPKDIRELVASLPAEEREKVLQQLLVESEIEYRPLEEHDLGTIKVHQASVCHACSWEPKHAACSATSSFLPPVAQPKLYQARYMSLSYPPHLLAQERTTGSFEYGFKEVDVDITWAELSRPKCVLGARVRVRAGGHKLKQSTLACLFMCMHVYQCAPGWRLAQQGFGAASKTKPLCFSHTQHPTCLAPPPTRFPSLPAAMCPWAPLRSRRAARYRWRLWWRSWSRRRPRQKP